jgi:hypothetical protein
MFIKKTLTAVAVDSFRDYLKEQLDKIKELDLDKDGQKDVDQIADLLMHLSAKVKDAIESTDFPKLASGLEQIMAGVTLMGASVDRIKLADACSDVGAGMTKLGSLLQLGIRELKQVEKNEL